VSLGPASCGRHDNGNVCNRNSRDSADNMTTQSTQCAAEELAELEEWLRSRGIELVEKDAAELAAGEYTKVLNEPRDGATGETPVWTVTWYPNEA